MRRHNIYGRTSYARNEDFVPSATTAQSYESRTSGSAQGTSFPGPEVQDSDLPIPRRRREAIQRPDGSVNAYEEIVEPNDELLRVYRERERRNILTNPNYLDHRLQMQQEKNRHEMELLKAQREAEVIQQEADREAEEWFEKVNAKLDRAQKKKNDRIYARTYDELHQLLSELSVTPENLHGCGYVEGFCPSRASLHPRYLFTILFYGVVRVKRDTDSDSITAYYSSKPPETIKIARNSMTGHAEIHMIPERRMCIVDVHGSPIVNGSLCDKLCGNHCLI